MQQNRVINRPSEKLKVLLSALNEQTNFKNLYCCDDQFASKGIFDGSKYNLSLSNIDNTRDKRKDNTINFFDVVNLTQTKDDYSTGQESNNFDIALDDNLTEHKKSNKNMLKNKLSMQFFITNLQNDSRIKHFEQVEKEIIIDFWNVRSSISFYKQYIDYIEMNFIDKYNKYKRTTFKPFIVNNIPWREPSKTCSTFLDYLTPCKVTVKIDHALSDTIQKSLQKGLDTDDKNETFEDRIIYFSSLSKHFNQYETKIIQIKIENEDYDYLLKNAKELSVGHHTNVNFQEVVKKLPTDLLNSIVEKFEYDIGPISATKYGAYVIQNLVLHVQNDCTKELIKKYMAPNLKELLKHPIGNYSAQAIINFDYQFILDAFLKNFTELVNNELGFKVFKNCFFSFEKERKLIKEMLNRNKSSIERKKYNEILLLLKK